MAFRPLVDALPWLDAAAWDHVLESAALSLLGRAEEIDAAAVMGALQACGLEPARHRIFLKGCKSLLKRAVAGGVEVAVGQLRRMGMSQAFAEVLHVVAEQTRANTLPRRSEAQAAPEEADAAAAEPLAPTETGEGDTGMPDWLANAPGPAAVTPGPVEVPGWLAEAPGVRIKSAVLAEDLPDWLANASGAGVATAADKSEMDTKLMLELVELELEMDGVLVTGVKPAAEEPPAEPPPARPLSRRAAKRAGKLERRRARKRGLEEPAPAQKRPAALTGFELHDLLLQKRWPEAAAHLGRDAYSAATLCGSRRGEPDAARRLRGRGANLFPLHLALLCRAPAALLQRLVEAYPRAVRARPGRLSGFSIFHSKSNFYGTFVWARRVRNSQKRRVSGPGRCGSRRASRAAACTAMRCGRCPSPS
jgi:hypothetical protein